MLISGENKMCIIQHVKIVTIIEQFIMNEASSYFLRYTKTVLLINCSLGYKMATMKNLSAATCKKLFLAVFFLKKQQLVLEAKRLEQIDKPI